MASHEACSPLQRRLPRGAGLCPDDAGRHQQRDCHRPVRAVVGPLVAYGVDPLVLDVK